MPVLPLRAPLSLTRSGRGEPLVLLHGMGSSRRDFSAVLPALAERFDVLALDLPGCGESPHLGERPTVAVITDAVERTLDAEEVGRVHVLGNSLGARVALELARRGRTRSVVAIAPSGLNVPPERAVQGTGMALARVVVRTAAPLVEPLSRYLPLVPGSRFRPLLWAGHAPQSDRPETIVRLVEETAGRAAAPPAEEVSAPPRRSGRRTGTGRSPSPR